VYPVPSLTPTVASHLPHPNTKANDIYARFLVF
jgi:hypothetical protein